MEDFNEAMRYKLLSMDIERKHLGETHPQMGASYSNLAVIQQAQGDRPAACANFRKALAILLKHFDENHPRVKIVREWMSEAGCSE